VGLCKVHDLVDIVVRGGRRLKIVVRGGADVVGHKNVELLGEGCIRFD